MHSFSRNIFLGQMLKSHFYAEQAYLLHVFKHEALPLQVSPQKKSLTMED